MRRTELGMFAVTVAAVCFGVDAVEVADFTSGVGTTGWTVSDGKWCSPAYVRAIDQIRLVYHGNGEGTASIYARPEGGAESLVATISAVSSAATFEFPETTDFRSFRIVSSNGLALSSFTACVSAAALDAPSGVAISNNVTGTSFDASWSAVEGATGYRVYVWTNTVVDASVGTALWQETFANAPEKTSTVNFKDEFTDNGATGWTFEKAYASISNGAVRIGNTEDKGVLVSPPLPAFSESPLTLRITAWRQTAGDGADMPLGIVSGDVTNVVGVVALGDHAVTCHVALPALNANDRIALFSPTNKASARVIVDDVAIVSGHSAGQPSYFVNGLDVGAATVCSFAGLPSVPVQFAVEAYGRRGVTSAKMAVLEVDLAHPGDVAVLNACPLSSLTGSVLTYTQDFDSLASLTATIGDKKWFNGTTLPYWQAYRGDTAVTSIKYNGGAENSGGLYALSANRSHAVRALGAYSTQNDEFSFGLAFTNDTDRAVNLSSVAYLAQQWGFKNEASQTMSVAVKVVDGLDWISAFGDGWMELGSTQSDVYGLKDVHDTPVSTRVEIVPEEVLSIAPGQVLMIKWTIHSLKSGKSGIMGIDDVTVSFEKVQEKQGTVIHIVDSAH